jgi:hypothetical protein
MGWRSARRVTRLPFPLRKILGSHGGHYGYCFAGCYAVLAEVLTLRMKVLLPSSGRTIPFIFASCYVCSWFESCPEDWVTDRYHALLTPAKQPQEQALSHPRIQFIVCSCHHQHHHVVLRQVYTPFESEFSRQCDLVLHFSVPSIVSFPYGTI